MTRAWSDGVGFQKAGYYEEALERYSALLRALLDGGDVPPGPLLEGVADVAAHARREGAALDFLGALRAQCREKNDPLGELHALVKCALVCLKAGDGPVATAFVCEALRTLPGVDAQAAIDPWDVPLPRASAAREALARFELALAFGHLAAFDGHYECALSFLEGARRNVRAHSELVGVVWSLDEMAVYCRQLATDKGTRWEDTNAGPGLPGTRASMAWRLIRAQHMLDEGRLSECRSFALDFLRSSVTEDALRARAYLTLAHAEYLLNRVAGSEAALRGAERCGHDAASARQLQEMRRFITLKGRAVDAEAGLPFVPELVLRGARAVASPDEAEGVEEGLARVGRPERFKDWWGLHANALSLAMATKDASKVIDAANSLEAVARDTDSETIQARTSSLLGVARYELGDYAGSRALLEQAHAVAISGGRALDAWRSARVLSWIEARDGGAPGAKGGLARAGNADSWAHQARTSLGQVEAALSPADRAYFRLNKWSAHDEYASARLRQAPQVPASRAPFRWLRLWLERRALQRRLYRSLHEIACLLGWGLEGHGSTSASSLVPDTLPDGAHVASWVAAQIALAARGDAEATVPEEPYRLSRRLPADMAVVHYYVLPERTYAFVLARNRIELIPIDETRIAVERGARAFIRALGQPPAPAPTVREVEWTPDLEGSDQRPEGWRDAAGRLSKILRMEQVLAACPPGTRHIALVPHGTLTNIPFGALLDGDGAPLCTRFAVSILPGLGWLSKRLPIRSARPRTPLVLGKSQFPAEAKLGHLECVPDECKAVALRLGGATLWVDEPDMVGRLRENIGRHDWLHIATHGNLDVDAPHQSWLYLTGQGGAGATLTVAELQSFDLRHVRAVVLSCCWTSGSVVLPGQELIGMPAALLRKGAGAVVAPLWAVDDEMAKEFMIEFSEFVAGGDQPAMALHRVQKAWFEGARGALQSPCHWAPFVAYGFLVHSVFRGMFP